MKIGKTRLSVDTVHLTKLDVQGIVNPANDMLWLGGGISAEIRRAGGDSIEKEALEKAPAAPGNTVATGAGTLPARWIFHAVIAGQDLTANVETVRKAVRASLEKAESVRCTTLAVPLLVTGTHDGEVHVIVRAIVEETVKYLIDRRHSFESIVFIDNDEETRHLFNDALIEKFTKHG